MPGLEGVRAGWESWQAELAEGVGPREQTIRAHQDEADPFAMKLAEEVDEPGFIEHHLALLSRSTQAGVEALGRGSAEGVVIDAVAVLERQGRPNRNGDHARLEAGARLTHVHAFPPSAACGLRFGIAHHEHHGVRHAREAGSQGVVRDHRGVRTCGRGSQDEGAPDRARATREAKREGGNHEVHGETPRPRAGRASFARTPVHGYPRSDSTRTLGSVCGASRAVTEAGGPTAYCSLGPPASLGVRPRRTPRDSWAESWR